MAKVTGPLMSMSASGTVGNTITFDKRGFVRQRVIPANPQSDSQGNVRQMLLGIQRGITKLGATVIAAVKTVSPVAYRWNSFLLQQVLGPGSSEFEASRTAFLALTTTQQDTWTTQAVAAGLTEQSITYASDDAISAGLALFAICRALFALGFNTSAGTPGAANQSTWKTYFVS
jgi:hypothetical protein